MTLLAAIVQKSEAFLVSDVLQIRVGEKITHTPHAIYPVEEVLTEEYWRSAGQPTQKIYVINPTLCAGVAGNYFTAKAMILELRDRFASQDAPLEEIRSFLCSDINFGSAPAVLLGLLAHRDRVFAFRFYSGKKELSVGTEFFEGTGGPQLERQLKEPAERKLEEIKRPSGKPASRRPPSILHEVAEIAFYQHNAGHFLLDEFGGGFQVIEFMDGTFKFVESYLLLSCFANFEDDDFTFSFGSSVVLQRYLSGSFVVASCPIKVENVDRSLRIQLKTADSKWNLVEDWLNPCASPLLLNDVWRELVVDYYLLAIIWQRHESKYLSSIVNRRVDSEYFSLRLSSSGDLFEIIIGKNFEILLNLNHQSMKRVLSGLEGDVNEITQIAEYKAMLLRYENAVFENKEVLLDGGEYINCRFIRCRLQIAGGIFHLRECGFHNCQFEFADCAGRTINFLRHAMRPGSGVEDLARLTMNYITGIDDADNTE